MSFDFDPSLSQPVHLPYRDSTWPEAWHLFDESSVWAIRAAISSGRPLLLRGEPGIGKSQLARAAAEVLKVPFLYQVVDERSERDELLYSYDAVARLAEAQVSALVAKEDPKWRDRLAERNFIRPGVLWWAFNWDSAKEQAGFFSDHCRTCREPFKPDGWSSASKKPCGPVVLLDEIDKADPSLPNGLLESLGNDGFQTAQLGEPVRLPEGAKPPLVIVTTNEERELPAAFLRRCLVLQMGFPAGREEAIAFLVRRARVIHPIGKISDGVCRTAAEHLWADRERAVDQGGAVPGAAEFLDLVKSLVNLAEGDEAAQISALEKIRNFALRKNLSDAR